MKNILFQGFSVGCRSLLVFSFFYLVKSNFDDIEASEQILNFSSSVLFGLVLTLGQDQVFVLNRSSEIPFKLIIIRILIAIFLYCAVLTGTLKLSFFLMTIGLMFLQEIKSSAKYTGRHALDALSNLLAIVLFYVFSLFIKDLSLAFGFSIIVSSLPIWLISVQIIKPKKFNILFNLKMFLSSSLLYAFLNIDWIFFKFSDFGGEYADFAINQKVAINLSLIASIIGSVVIGWNNSIIDGRIKAYYFLGGVVAICTYIYSPLIVQQVFEVGNGNFGIVNMWFAILLILRFIVSWAEIPLKREGKAGLRAIIAFLLVFTYAPIGYLFFSIYGPVGLVIAMVLVHFLYILYLVLFNSTNKLWSHGYF